MSAQPTGESRQVWVVALTAAHLVLVALLLAGAEQAGLLGSPTLATLPFALAVALVGSMRMTVEFGRYACWVTMVEAVVVGMLLHLEPAGVLGAVALGEALACAWRRQPVLKLLYNVGSASLAALVAGLVYVLLHGGGTMGPSGWAAALVAVGCYATATHASTSAVLAVVEDGRFSQLFAASLAAVAIASAVSASIGLVAVVLIGVTPAAVLLALPLVLVMVAETRRLATHRAEKLRFERLYAASSRTGGLQTLPDVMAVLADEARSLVTGATGICSTVDRSGAWFGVVVDDAGKRSLPPPALGALLLLADGPAAGELPAGQLPDELGAVLSSAASLVVSHSVGSAAAPVVLAVLRELDADDGDRARAEVLDAFIGHAALTVANARLYADVEDALAHQVDLNRQKDDFVAVVSHELRTPLASMIGSVSTMRSMEERLGTAQRARLVDMALRQGKRLQHLIEDLLLLATVEQAELVRPADDAVDLGSMVEEITAELAAPRPDEAPAVVHFEDTGTGPIRSDERKLRRVLSNLIENAVKYAPQSAIHVRVERGADTVVVEVIDSGPGIGPADRARVFERFVQLDQTSTRTSGGTGLGLYLCRQLAGVLGGQLTLSDADGGGCRFTLNLPCIQAPCPQTADADLPRARPVATISAGGARR